MAGITNEQRRKIFGLAKGLGLVGEEGMAHLHALVYDATGKESIRDLTTTEANKVIRRLASLLSLKEHRPGRATARELWKQRQLARELGWNDEQLMAFIKRMAKVDRAEWQSSRDASNIIEGLKAMLKRKQKGVQAVGDSADGKAPAAQG